MVEFIGLSLRLVICTLGLCILGLKYALAKCSLVLSNSFNSVLANSEYSVLFCVFVMCLCCVSIIMSWRLAGSHDGLNASLWYVFLSPRFEALVLMSI